MAVSSSNGAGTFRPFGPCQLPSGAFEEATATSKWPISSVLPTQPGPEGYPTPCHSLFTQNFAPPAAWPRLHLVSEELSAEGVRHVPKLTGQVGIRPHNPSGLALPLTPTPTHKGYSLSSPFRQETGEVGAFHHMAQRPSHEGVVGGDQRDTETEPETGRPSQRQGDGDRDGEKEPETGRWSQEG